MRRFGVAAVLAAAAVMLVAASMQWIAPADFDAFVIPGSDPLVDYTVSGSQAVPGLEGLALALAAGSVMLALMTVSSWVRAAMGFAMAFATMVIGVQVVMVLRQPGATFTQVMTERQSPITVDDVTVSLWPWLLLVLCLVAVVGSTDIIRQSWASAQAAGTNPALSSVGTRAAVGESAGSENQTEADPPAQASDLWDAQDRGEDPTVS